MNEIYFEVRFDIDIDGKTYRMVKSIVPDSENDPISIKAIPDHCAR